MLLVKVFKLGFFLLVLSFIIYHSLSITPPAHADELEDLQKQISELTKAREQSIAATKPLEGQLDSLKRQLTQIQARLDNLSFNIQKKEQELNLREEKLAEKYVILETRVRSYYIHSYLTSPLLVLLSVGSTGDLFRELGFRQNLAREDRQVITSITAEILDLLSQKENLQKDKASLSALQSQVDKQASFLGGEVKKAKEYQAQLSSKIAQLTLRQQQIIAQKLGSLNLPTSLGAGPLFCTDDRNLNPGFSSGFVFFTYGIPHRVGMNQYGVYGRALAGQNHEDILKAYFQDFSFEQRPNINIPVQGYGSMPLETYLLGIYEMPDSWPMEALKAQAIAARSYALAFTNNGQSEICTSQLCQVYKGGNKGGNWERAVNETNGKTMVSQGSAVKAWYSSTDGGYTFTSGDVWGSNRSFTKRVRDTTGDIAGFGDLFGKAYDKDSPCFYAAQGFRAEYAKSAWLKPEELADVVNTILLARADSGTRNHLYQQDKPNPEGTDNWDVDRVKQELRARGQTPLNSASSVSVTADFSSGMTTSITISGDGGAQTFNGIEFKNFFNLRAPANIQIVGPLYNVERR